jgi:glycosyltransferase involved in cell wall biosynthesis
MNENINPLVSIVIACHNSREWIRNAIESAIKQTYTKTEIIVVDDGSDDTPDIVKEYPVKYIHIEDRGPVESFNRGVAMTNGEFFIKLDADNAIDDSYVDKTLNEMLKDDRIGFVYTAERRFGREVGIRPAPLFNKWSLLYRNYVHSGSLVRRKAFEDAGGYDDRLDAADDWDLWITISHNGWRGKAVREPLHFYQVHDIKQHTSMGMNSLGNINAFKFIVQKHRFPYAVFACRLIFSWLFMKIVHPKEKIYTNWRERYIVRSFKNWAIGMFHLRTLRI